jgi:hypothetical protein
VGTEGKAGVIIMAVGAGAQVGTQSLAAILAIGRVIRVDGGTSRAFHDELLISDNFINVFVTVWEGLVTPYSITMKLSIPACQDKSVYAGKSGFCLSGLQIAGVVIDYQVNFRCPNDGNMQQIKSMFLKQPSPLKSRIVQTIGDCFPVTGR